MEDFSDESLNDSWPSEPGQIADAPFQERPDVDDLENLSEIYNQIESMADQLQVFSKKTWDLLGDHHIPSVTRDTLVDDSDIMAELASSLRNLTLHNVIERISVDDQSLDNLFDEVDFFESSDHQRILFANRFELCEILGRGSYGIVYKAFDRNTQREVALKFPRPELKGLKTVREKFYIEGTSVSQVVHPGLVPLLDIGFADGTPYLVSRLVNGPNLEQWLEQSQHPMIPRLAVKWVKELADAVEHLHSHNILHGDLKPSNILLEHPYSDEPSELPPELLSVRVTDFGSVSRLHDDMKKGVKGLQGTLCFMAPELIDSQGGSDARADVYAISAILYELITHRPVFDYNDPDRLRQAICTEEPTPPRVVNPQVPYALNAIVLKGLEKNPDNRFSTARELSENLDALLNLRTPGVLMNNPLVRTNLWLRRNWLLTASVLFVSLILSTAYVWRLGRQQIQAQVELERTRLSWWNQYVDTLILGYKFSRINAIPRMHAALDSVRTWPDEAKNAEDPREFGWFHLNYKTRSKSRLVSGLPPDTSHYVMAVCDQTKTIWIGGEDGVLREIDPVNATLIRERNVQPESIEAIAMSRDGKYIATGDDFGHIIVFQLPDIKTVAVSDKHNKPISDLQFSRDSKFLVSSSQDGTLNIWDFIRSETKKVFDDDETDSDENLEPKPQLFGLTSLPDPNLVAVASEDGSIRIIDLHDATQVRKLQGHHDSVSEAVLSSDMKYLVSISRDLSICCWDLSNYSLINRINLFNSDTLQVTDAAMGRQIDKVSQLIHINHLNTVAVDVGYGTIELIQIPSGSRMGTLFGHSKPSFSLAYLGWSKQLASFSRDDTMRIWDAPLTENWIGQLMHFELLSDDYGIERPVLWDITKPWQERMPDGQSVQAFKSPFEAYIVTSTVFNKKRDWVMFSNDTVALQQKKLVNRLELFAGPATANLDSPQWYEDRKRLFEKVIVNPVGEPLLTGHPDRPLMTFLAGDGVLYLINLENRDNPNIFELDSGVNSAIFLPDRPEILVFSTGSIKPNVFNYEKMQWEGTWVEDEDDADWITGSVSPDGKTLAVHRAFGKLQFWDYKSRKLKSQTLIPETGQRRFRELVWCKNSKEIFVALALKDLFLIDETTGKIMGRWDFGNRRIHKTQLSADGQSLWVYDGLSGFEKTKDFARRLTRIYAPAE